MSYLKSKLPELSPSVKREAWRQALLDAASELRLHGHCQNEWVTDDGRRCVLGAIAKTRRTADYREVKDRLCAYLGLADVDQGIIDWNNAPGRTAADVISALEACARQG